MSRSEWPQDPNILRRRLGNFRPTILERSTRPKRDWRAARPGMSEAHLDDIRQLPCAVPGCTERDIEAHHLLSGPAKRERGLGIKATDRWSLPLCRWLHHAEVHRRGARSEHLWFQSFGLSPYELAEALWNARGQLETMRGILAEHQRFAIREVAAERARVLASSNDDWRRA